MSSDNPRLKQEVGDFQSGVVRHRRRDVWVSLALILLLVAGGFVYKQGHDADVAGAKRDQVAADNAKKTATKYQRALRESNAKVSALSIQVLNLGKKPIVSGSPVVVQGPPGPVGPPISKAENVALLLMLCGGDCKGKTGKAGETGATGAEGRAGADGTNGRDGKDATPCPDGTSMQTTQVMTSLVDTLTIYACR